MAAWHEAVEAYHETSAPGPLSSDQIAKLIWSSLHGRLGLWRNVVDHVSDAGELESLRQSMLLAIFGRT